MATYAIGDLQGCRDAFEQLLEAIDFDARSDRLWLVGDLVNRGPDSLGTLRRVRELGDAAVVVLGNHDLHLLAASVGARHLGPADTLQPVLSAPDANELLEWLRHRPLAHAEIVGSTPYLMIHAGVLPQWTHAQVLEYATELEAALHANEWTDLMSGMYGDQPDRWDERLVGTDRLRVLINAFTRLRVCSADGVMNLSLKEGADHAPPGFMPWFEVPTRQSRGATLIFGHWSTLGLLERNDLLGLDTGCVWGGALTAIRLEDRRRWQVACRQYRRPG